MLKQEVSMKWTTMQRSVCLWLVMQGGLLQSMEQNFEEEYDPMEIEQVSCDKDDEHGSSTTLLNAVANYKGEQSNFFAIKELIMAGMIFSLSPNNEKILTWLLHDAIVWHDMYMAQWCLNRGISPNAYHKDNDTWVSMLHVAIDHENQAMAQLLLDQGANVNGFVILNRNDVPLHKAVEQVSPAMVELLLNYKPDMNRVGELGLSPLGLASNRISEGDSGKVESKYDRIIAMLLIAYHQAKRRNV